MAEEWVEGRKYTWTHDGKTEEVILINRPTRGDFGFRSVPDAASGEYPGPILTCTVKLIGSGAILRALASDLSPAD